MTGATKRGEHSIGRGQAQGRFLRAGRPVTREARMLARRGAGVAVVVLAALVLACQASAASVVASDGLVSVSDVSAGSTRSVSVAAWLKALRAPRGTAAAGGVLTVADSEPLTVVSRALLAPSVKLAKRYQRAAGALSPARLGGFDRAALGAAPVGATRAVWRVGALVGQITLIDRTGRVGTATQLAAIVRARVQAVASRTAWDGLVADAVASSRPPSTKLALQAFALAFGPVPGVRTPSGSAADVSDTLALQWIAASYGELSARQRGAVKQVLARVLGPAKRAHSAAAQTAAQDEKTAQAAVAFLSPQMDLPGLAVVVRYALDPGHPDSEATSLPPREDIPPGFLQLVGRESLPNTCIVFLLGPGQSASGEDRAYLIAHEVFHCLIEHGIGYVQNKFTLPWLGEGGAVFAGCAFAPGANSINGPHAWYAHWIDSHDWPIPDQTYSGVGLLTEMQNAGVNVLGQIKHGFGFGWSTASTEPMLEALAGGQYQDVLDNWASTFLTTDPTRTEPGWGTGSGCVHAQDPGYVLKPELRKVDVNKTIDIVTEPWINDIYQITGNATVIHVQTTRGTVRINGGDSTDDKNVKDAYYCVGQAGCQCPPPQAEDLRPDKRSPLVAVTGGEAGASLTITGVPEVCPVITQARFTVTNASFNAASGSGTTSWTANLNWDVSWDSTSSPSSLPLILGNYMYANAGTMSGGGSYTTTIHSQPPTTCTGSLILSGPGTPSDALIKVTGDTTQGQSRTWTLQLRATDYDSFFPSGGDCPAPPFGDSSDSFDGHLWEADLTLPATGSQTQHTVTIPVAANPSHSSHETWTGTVTLTGIF